MDKAAPPQLQDQFTLPYAFVRAALLVVAVFLILVLVVWYYTSTILEREERLVSLVVPELDVAYQLTAATAQLQSESLLLPTASTMTSLQQHRESIDRLLEQTQSILHEPAMQRHRSIDALRASADRFENLVQALYENRQKELTLQLELSSEKSAIIEELILIETDSVERIVELTDRFLSASVKLAERLALDAEHDDAHISQQRHSLSDIEYSGLMVQDYELLNQDLQSLAALAERVPLLRNSNDLNRIEQLRDLTIRKLLNRAVYLGDDESGLLLVEGISQIRKQLNSSTGLLGKQHKLIDSQSRLIELQSELTSITQDILKRSQVVRSLASESLKLVYKQNTLGLKRYRHVLTLAVFVTLLLLSAVSFWLLYRNLMRPLAGITERLHGIGSEKTTAADQTYLFKEMEELSTAISDLDRAQAVMKRKDRLLESNVTELTRANRDLEQFAHVASHDLQEPLRKLQQFTALLKEDYDSVLCEGDGRFYLDVISKSSQRMRTLIHDTLEYSRTGLSEQSIELVDLQAMITSLCQELDVLISESKADIQVAELPEIHANLTGMNQLFRNLITNAIKYHRKGIPPQIQIKFHKEINNEEFVIEVHDNGIGIAPQYTERVFSPFERLGIEVPGTGLGLAICKKVCESHGWTLKLESSKGHGSCFRIRGSLADVVDTDKSIDKYQKQRRFG